jgi:hypothetical protein
MTAPISENCPPVRLEYHQDGHSERALTVKKGNPIRVALFAINATCGPSSIQFRSHGWDRLVSGVRLA